MSWENFTLKSQPMQYLNTEKHVHAICEYWETCSRNTWTLENIILQYTGKGGYTILEHCERCLCNTWILEHMLMLYLNGLYAGLHECITNVFKGRNDRWYTSHVTWSVLIDMYGEDVVWLTTPPCIPWWWGGMRVEYLAQIKMLTLSTYQAFRSLY